MSNTSLGIGSVCSENICGQSPPVLTSSPPLISEIDTNRFVLITKTIHKYFLQKSKIFFFDSTGFHLKSIFTVKSYNIWCKSNSILCGSYSIDCEKSMLSNKSVYSEDIVVVCIKTIILSVEVIYIPYGSRIIPLRK